jgi:hypothetical protein
MGQTEGAKDRQVEDGRMMDGSCIGGRTDRWVNGYGWRRAKVKEHLYT